MSDEALANAAKLFRSAGEEERLRLLALLTAGEWCVTELAEATDANLSTVSQRLSVLRADGLVTRRREGKHAWYRLADAHVAGLITNALDHAGEDPQT
ncbi:MAG: metalloregulator ArsR/SmtB family transcription factor [Actinomycetota bacterium]|nr:metalloregulator ArsR/SmtB family transcription factor [Actinomycetota bacterium]